MNKDVEQHSNSYSDEQRDKSTIGGRRDNACRHHSRHAEVARLSRDFERVHDGFRISVENTAEATSLICNNPELFVDYEITKGKMDDVFLAVTGKKLSGGDDE